MNKRIWLLFLVLSITPFARSCDITAGFPLPVAGDILELDMKQFFSKELLKGLIFLIVNVSILSCAAAALIKRQETIPWLRSFYNSLLINLYLNWSGFLVLLAFPKDEPPKIFLAIFQLSTYCVYRAPRDISYWITKSATGNSLLDDIIFRMWFMVTVAALTALLYALKRKGKKPLQVAR